ncbi:BREX system serine/threonine kinase PglW [Longispora sp. NPDC051575]|uniref:BREX system serine/threonine kinase PglW n=1 Tax=Longispora sp. NPDC051575 TaxID=3154943 RepID=UPI003422269B
MLEGRWKTVTPSQFEHEREALSYLQQLLPDAEPYRAWSNFTFTADTGHVYEVDLLVATRSGLYLIEIKSYSGALTASGSNWIYSAHGKTRVFDNPLHLADAKAKRLKSLLQRSKKDSRLPVPFIQPVVFLSKPGMQVDLPDHQLHWVYGTAQGLPDISTVFGEAPRSEKQRVTPEISRKLPDWLKAAGIARSRKHYQVGLWNLERVPLDSGPTWQDHRATHRELENEHRRIRLYLVEHGIAAADRDVVERAAQREMRALKGISHPNIVQVLDYASHEVGPALIFQYRPESMRLDHYMVQYGALLDVDTRLELIRQLAEAVKYAHSRQLRHQALSARSVLVEPTRRRGAAEDGWLSPVLRISDWQTATRGAATGSNRNTSNTDAPIVLRTPHMDDHLDVSGHVYLAPELKTADCDPVALDVFGLGTLSYLILTGKPPAGSRAELVQRLGQEQGLRPSALVDSISSSMDVLVQAATAPSPLQRLATVDEFLDLLTMVEDELTAPSVQPSVVEPDPLVAVPDDVIGEWRIVKRLGTGSTCRAYLAEHLESRAQHVLKVGLSDDKTPRLQHEASVLRDLKDSRVIGLARTEPIRLGDREVLVLEHAGDTTVARKLREDGRLTIDDLERYSGDLFEALDYLEGMAVTHRDLKPENIAIKVRKNRTRQLVVFDFSLANSPVTEIAAGTPRYLDPFLGTSDRQRYDSAAEWYALAVTLHEMASAELPVWGDGATEPQLTEGPPVLAVEAFDEALRPGLTKFFTRALHRDASARYPSLKELRNAWQQVFRAADATPPSVHPEPVEDTPEERAWIEAELDKQAAAATRETPLVRSGLSQRALDAALRLNAHTVGDLLPLSSRVTVQAGTGANTRKELLRRIGEWRSRLDEVEKLTPVVPAVGPEKASLDAIVAELLPKPRRGSNGNASEIEATRLLLGLPDADGHLPALSAWPQQPAVAAALGVTPGRIAQILTKQRKRWHANTLLKDGLRAEVIELLADAGRVSRVLDLAKVLPPRRGSVHTDERLRTALGLAALRAVYELDALSDDPRFKLKRYSDGRPMILALEVGPNDGPDTPAGPALVDYVDKLGQVADRLVRQESLPSPATVLTALAVVPNTCGVDDRQMVQFSALASATAAVSPRLELYPRDLPPERALRLAQAGTLPSKNQLLTRELISQRVQARFPELPELPKHRKLLAALQAAGFSTLRDYDPATDSYIAAPAHNSSSAPARRLRHHTVTTRNRIDDTPERAEANRTEERLLAAEGGGFRALTVRLSDGAVALTELDRFGIRPVSVATLFMAELHGLVDERPKPTWETVLNADVPGSGEEKPLVRLTGEAWRRVLPALQNTLGDGPGPVLLHDAGVLAKYEAMGLLHDLVEAARAGAGALWVLCPADDPTLAPRLDGTIVPAMENERIVLTNSWIDNTHRSAA